MNKLVRSLLTAGALVAMTASAFAQQKVVWWDFLGGGDGVRMKALIEKFNKEHAGQIEIEGTTLEWGVPYYSKVQTAAAVGEGPDVMTYHLSRLPLGVSAGTLREITPEELASVGLGAESYVESNFNSAQSDGKIYAIPFDIHAIIMYYNKDLLKEAGLLGDDGLPKGLDGAENFAAALKKLTDGPAEYGLSIDTAESGSEWRIFYSLLHQQGGKLIGDDNKVLSGDNLDKAVKATETVRSWIENGWAPKLIDYPASVALFTAGDAALHINGVWEVPTMVDLHKSGKLGFEWGAVRVPVLFDQPATWADSHAFAIPNNVGKEISKEKLDAVLKVIAWMNKESLFWATAGHIPAYKAITETAEYKAMQPNATYSVLAENAVFDPSTTITGVASPAYDAILNYFIPAINGDMDVREAVESIRDELQGLMP